MGKKTEVQTYIRAQNLKYRQAYGHRQTDIRADRQTEIQTDIRADRQTEIQTDIRADRQTAIQTDIRADRQTEIQTDIRADRQTAMETTQVKTTEGKWGVGGGGLRREGRRNEVVVVVPFSRCNCGHKLLHRRAVCRTHDLFRSRDVWDMHVQHDVHHKAGWDMR